MSRPSTGFPRRASRFSRAGSGAASAAGVDLAAVFGPVRSQNAFEETVERLLAVIKLGVVGPGERFPPERELATLLGVSRITLREAIGDLRNAGYVESRRGRFGGTFVRYTPPSPSRVELRRIAVEDADKINDALTFRMAVETGAAQILAQLAESGRDDDGHGRDGHGRDGQGPDDHRRDDHGRDGQRRARERVRDVLLTRLAAVNQSGPEDYRRMDTLFHLAIAELTGSTLLASACADARVRLNDLLNAIPVLQRNIDHTAAQHTAIVEGILAGDTRRAQRAVAEHLDGTAALLRGFLE
jgi:DNA-binding FadR family transcriptional regulator